MIRILEGLRRLVSKSGSNVQKSCEKFWRFGKKSYLCTVQDNFPWSMIIMNTQSDYNHSVEVIGFVKGWQQATVVTDGEDTRSFTPEACTPHRDVKSAIAHLEARGFRIIPDMAW